MSSIRVIILGSGTSHGIPMIGCSCSVCTSPDPRDRRTRTSILVQTVGASILVDTSPEFRLQCLANNVTRIDAVLFTHHHADHVVGLDDLRRFNDLQRTMITCYANPATAGALRRMFDYAFAVNPDYPSAKPELELAEIDGQFEIAGVPVVPIPLFHGELPVLGFRFGSFAYCTDCSRIPDESWPLLEDLDVLVLDALRRRPHVTHFNFAQAIEAARRIAPRRTYLTHIAHELPHRATNAELPEDIELAYDGQVIELLD